MKNKIERYLAKKLCHYNHDKYWKMRSEVVDKHSKLPIVMRYYLWFKCKKIEGKNNSIIGTTLGGGALFKTPPILPHNLNGIIISTYAQIGHNATIMQQVTIGGSMKEGEEAIAPVIGDNVLLGAGAKIIGNVIIGNNVKVGANAVVTKDVPDNATVISETRIINR